MYSHRRLNKHHQQSGLSARRAPQGLRARWRAFKLPDGAVYFVDKETGETGWNLPGMRFSQRRAIAVSLNSVVEKTACWGAIAHPFQKGCHCVRLAQTVVMTSDSGLAFALNQIGHECTLA